MSINWPDITILLVTYDRLDEICKTIQALRRNIKYSGNIYFHIADDATPGNYLQDIRQTFPEIPFSTIVTNRLGWGANVNAALKVIETDYIFICEDDYVATSPLELDYGITLLKQREDVGAVRYDGLAGHLGLRLILSELITEQVWGEQPDHLLSKFDYFILDRKNTGHLNVYSNRPHLFHTRFHSTFGLYAEGVSLGQTETQFAHKVLATYPGIEIAALWNGILRAFEHIGHSRQGTALDPNREK